MKAKQILKLLKVVTWIVFIALCIKTGAMIISFFISLFVHPEVASNLYSGTDLSEIYDYGKWYYIAMASLVIVLSGLKSYLFYWVIKMFSKINLAKPFNQNVANLITKISYVAFEIGILGIISNGYAKGLMKKGLHFSYDGNGAEFLFLAGIVYVIAQIFNRGLEIQSENELTV
ncbi:DUF2975 domain-containing protein [Galbibacter sp. EGI 63066]|uniref:DUF2975 domain-containing protein n=1 Tax=Galbibacter sp. EGI 63066 TaxID=2993559 RepID=UPI002248B50C|nr:DUF2975 domain-containing protein [Galbibacter sp. EGI 63066]MCX2678737.1 DUF2975 domain-containing protein [Galbibacter sp. EGI 63066]